MSEPLVSVVIPAYNAAKIIERTIQALLNQTYAPVEIVIVNDGSTDNTAEICKNFPQIRFFSQSNAGPATARNLGAQKATGEILFFTDSDCIPHKDWIKTAIKHFQSEEIGVVAGSYGIFNENFCLSRCIHKEILYRHHNLMPASPKSFGSYNFGVRKAIFDEIGGFNTNYRHASGEDNDLSYKILKKGYKIRFEPHSLVDHAHTTSVRKYLKEQFRHGFWRVQMYFDHPKMLKGDDYTFWKDIIEVPLVGLILISGALTLVFSHLLWVFVGLICILFCIEVFYALLMIKNPFESIYYSFVMFFRAFSRTFGFSSGIIHFSTKKL